MLLDFNLARNESQFENIAYAPGLMEFDYIAGAAGFDLTLMLPMHWSEERLLEILVDGVAAEFVIEEVKGFEYAMLTTPVAEAHIAASYALPASADFNGDGLVDADDLGQWQGDFGASPESDADGDGDSDGEDFLQWQRQLGGTPANAATLSVPEPAMPFLLAIGAMVLAGNSRSRRLPQKHR
jgi:hypothetical protein